MTIAVTYENGQVYQHFGHTEQFKLYDVADGAVRACTVVETAGSGHGALAGMLQGLGVDTLLCGGIGGGARLALEQAGIRLYGGVTGDADAAVAALLHGRLQYDPAARCTQHDAHHGAHGGDCGAHHGSCGAHGCGEGH